MDIRLINDDDEKFANEKLAPYYENNRIPAEKKSYLTELNNNLGPFMGVKTRSGETHYLMDAASQIATLGLGFSPSVFMGTSHYLASWTNNYQDDTFVKLKNSLHNFLLRKTGWLSLDLTLCNSGAEGNEIALGYAYRRRLNPKARKVLAFEGSFHGRMLISLFSTWNKTKREPFQWPGYETVFTDYPELPDAGINLSYPDKWRLLWDESPSKKFSPPKEWEKDPVLKKEVDALLGVRKQLEDQEIFAIIIEPMQCEGGDRYSSDRFHTALLIMARSYGVPVIYDEVQTGFNLGREFFWHRQFYLQDEKGHQLNPDYLVCAKKAQVGMVLSPHELKRNKLEKKEQYQVASTIRGYLHGIALDQSKPRILKLEDKVKKHLSEFSRKFDKFIDRPRALGMSFAFDLKDQDHVQEFINRRFDHGLLYYPAGAKTLRFRLNTSFGDQDIQFLFERLTDIAGEVFLGEKSHFNGVLETRLKPNKSIEEWQNLILSARLKRLFGTPITQEKAQKDVEDIYKNVTTKEGKNLKLNVIDKSNFSEFSDRILKLQKDVYEPTRQTSLERFKVCAESDYGICLALTVDEELAAMAFSSSMKDHPLERGIRQDPDFEDPKCLYMIDTTVAGPYQNLGIGRYLKYSLTYLALARNYRAVKGRNRDRLAAGMLSINLSIGSYEQFFLKEDYPDFEIYRDVVFYNTPLEWRNKDKTYHLGNRINSPLSEKELSTDYFKKQLPYITNKVCLSNFVSERFLDHVKKVIDQLPSALQHCYTSSGQSECVDKVAKSIIYNKKETLPPDSCLLTFEGHYFGQGSFLSRSLSGSEDDRYFPVKKLERPTQENQDKLLNDIEDLLSTNSVNSIWVEPVSQLDYGRCSQNFLIGLKSLANKFQVPLVYNETAAQQFTYSNDHYFASNNDKISPDAGFVFLGGQGGLVFLREELFVSKPLMMISTWDGDEHAFATYTLAMENILKDPQKFIQTKNKFHKKITDLLKDYPNASIKIHEGRGLIRGPIPQSIKNILLETSEGYLCDPSYGAMLKFIGNKG